MALTWILASASCTSDLFCAKSLAEYCMGPCVDHDHSVAAARHLVDALGVACIYAQLGRCGPYQFVGSGGGYGANVEYFDDLGNLVGARVGSDVNQFCGGAASVQIYGHVPVCDEVVEHDLCAERGATDGGAD